MTLNKIVDRIETKLGTRNDPSIGISQDLAKSIYDTAKRIVPDEVLASLGVGNKVMEISGNALSRRISNIFEENSDHQRSCWISLDKNSEWFGGNSQ